jgi:polysaccharide export outer membrane protein
MRDFFRVRLLPGVAIMGVGLSSWAVADAPKALKAPPSEVNEATTASAPSTHLEVPAGTDVKITIEVLSKTQTPAPAAAPPAEPPVGGPPLIPHPSEVPPTDPIWAIERIKPMPLAPIPDDPPPHEGAMIELPYTVEPADLLVVEVIEALPGRPISGERLVRPDGTISLGFYGDLHVRGLTVSQIKAKVILHLRRTLPDEVLGLIEVDPEGKPLVIEPKDSKSVFVEVTAYNSKNYFVQGDVAAPGKLPHTGNETVLDALNYGGGVVATADAKNIRLVRPARASKPARVYKVDLEGIRERGEIEKNYQLFPGDRLIVGRNPVVTTTLEVDRLAAPIQTAINTILQGSFATRSLMQTATSTGTGSAMTITPEQREALIKEWVDFWWKAASRPDGAVLDEKTFREALMRALNPPAPEKK